MAQSDRTNQALSRRAKAVFTPNYRPAPICLDRGDGAYVFDVEGRRYLDMASGIAVSGLGHQHPALNAAIRAQSEKMLHTSNLYVNEPAIELAERLVAGRFPDRVFFCNSGAEANEAAIKLARKFACDQGDRDRFRIVSFEGSFHGRTFGALAATSQPKYHHGFEPLPAGFDYLPFGDVEALVPGITQRTAGVIVEPIQGEGGVRVPPPGFLAAIRARCDEVGALLLFDEVQVGVGRTGEFFGHEHDDVLPDIMSLAKGLAGGLPLGAMVATDRVGASLTYGSHATTFGGNPLACAAGCAVVDVIRGPGFLEHVRDVGARLVERLLTIGRRLGAFNEVRGRGLLLGVPLADECPFDATAVVDALRERGILAHVAGPRVLRLAPPLILTVEQSEIAASSIQDAMAGLMRSA